MKKALISFAAVLLVTSSALIGYSFGTQANTSLPERYMVTVTLRVSKPPSISELGFAPAGITIEKSGKHIYILEIDSRQLRPVINWLSDNGETTDLHIQPAPSIHWGPK